MLEKLFEILSKYPIGNIIIIIIVIGWLIWLIFLGVRKMLNANSEYTTRKLHEHELIEQMKTDIETTSHRIEQFQSEINTKLQELSTEEDDHIHEAISELREIIDGQSSRIYETIQRLEKIEQDIRILFQNDRNAYRDGIEEAYKKYVEGKEPISLNELKRIEDLYNTYREQNGGQSSPLIDMMITRIRNLPTIKRHRDR